MALASLKTATLGGGFDGLLKYPYVAVAFSHSDSLSLQAIHSNNVRLFAEKRRFIFDNVKRCYSFALMPEDDRFTKKLAWGFKGAYRVGCKEATTSDVAARILCKAISKAVKEGRLNFQIVPGILECLGTSLQKLCADKGFLFSAAGDIRETMHQDLQSLLMRQQPCETSRLCVDIAAQVFEKFTGCSEIDSATITDAFTARLGDALSDRHLFAVAVDHTTVRLKMRADAGRSAEEQRAFEAEVKSITADFLNRHFHRKGKDGMPAKRMPSLPRVNQPFRMEEVHLPV